jgi:hypothetical protein
MDLRAWIRQLFPMNESGQGLNALLLELGPIDFTQCENAVNYIITW